jgi:phage recombination protein Bet
VPVASFSFTEGKFMSDIATAKVSVPALPEAELISVLRNSFYPGASEESIKMVLSWCKASNKDPLRRPVHIVPMMVKTGEKDQKGYDIKKYRDVIMQGIGDYRIDAARTGEYAGMREAEWGRDVTEKLGDADFTFPEWCELTVFRLVKGQVCGFSSGRVYFRETYAAQSSHSEAPNAMWRKRPRGQLEKCAEAQALRRAFPEVGTLPTSDEMAGKSIDDSFDVMPSAPQEIPQPKAKIAEAKPSAPTEGAIDVEILPPESKQDGGLKASPGSINMLKAKAKHLEIDDEQLFLAHKLTSFDEVTQSQVKTIMAWMDK